MHQLPYDPADIRRTCREMARPIVREGGAPTVAVDAATGKVLEAFDRSGPDGERFIRALAGASSVLPPSPTDLLLLVCRELDDGTRRVTRSLVVTMPGPPPDDA